MNSIVVRHYTETPELSCPYGHVRRVLSGVAESAGNVHCVEVSEGSAHYHLGYDETYWILSGHGILQSGEQQWNIKEETVAFIPAGVPHTLKACEGNLRFLIFGTPAYSVDHANFKPRKLDEIHPIVRRKSFRLSAFQKIDLYPVISSEFCDGREPTEILKQIADGGAKIVQMREKHGDLSKIIHLAEKFRQITDQYGMILIINDRIDVALAVEADGVHLGQDDFPVSYAQSIAPNLIFGVSTHSLEEALKAQSEGADYINIGPLFATQTKTLSMAPLGIEKITEIKPFLHIPFTVMGGIKATHIPLLTTLGVQRIAMVTELTKASNPMQKTQQLRDLMQ